jgi:hypothetical protein
MPDDRVDDDPDAGAGEQVGQEAGALDHRTRDDGGGHRREHELEQQLGLDGNLRGGQGAERVAVAEPAAGPEEGVAVAEHDREAGGVEHDGDDDEVHQVLHEDVADVLGRGDARLDQGEPGLHEEDERGADEDPDGVDGRAQLGWHGGRSLSAGVGGARGEWAFCPVREEPYDTERIGA